MHKTTRLVGLFGVLAIVASACSSGATTAPSAAPSAAASAGASAAASAEPSAAPSAASGYQGTITFWNTQRDFEAKELQKIIDAWSAKNPGVTVKMDLVPFDGADKKYETAANAGNAPDLFRSDVGWVSGFANAGMLLDVTALIPADAKSDFLEAPLATATYQGKIWGIPQVTDALGLQCNKKLLTQAGLSAAPTTWDDLVAAGTKVTDLKAQKFGFYMNADSYWSQPFVWGWGGKLFTANDQGKIASVDVNSPEAVAGWTYLKDKIVGTVTPATWDFKTNYDNMDAGFKAGNTMCILQGPWQVADLLAGDAFKADKANLVIAPVPDGVSGKTGSPVGGHDYVINVDAGKDAAKQAAIMDFVMYLSSPESQAALAKSLGLLPTRKSAYDNADVKADPIISMWGAVLAKATNRSGVPGAQNIYKPFSDHFQAFLSGSETAQAALDAVAAAWKTDVFKSQMAQ